MQARRDIWIVRIIGFNKPMAHQEIYDYQGGVEFEILCVTQSLHNLINIPKHEFCDFSILVNGLEIVRNVEVEIEQDIIAEAFRADGGITHDSHWFRHLSERGGNSRFFASLLDEIIAQ